MVSRAGTSRPPISSVGGAERTVAMERLLERLRGAGPPLRLSEFVRLTGYSRPTIEKLIDAGVIETVGLTEERRIPIREALRIARDLKIVEN